MKLIVGLGNPGDKYAGNRHNIGFMTVDEIAHGYRFTPWKRRFQGMTAEGQVGIEKCVLLKPQTFMNESGRAVGEAMRFYKLDPGDVIVIHDELDLVPGTVRVKTGGGNAGHNGLKSISAYIGNEYKRVRLGIGHPGDKSLVSNYVLQDFSKADRTWLQPFIEAIAKGMARLVEGADAAFLNDAGRRATGASLNGKGLSSTMNGTPIGMLKNAGVMPAAAREGGSTTVSHVVVMDEIEAKGLAAQPPKSAAGSKIESLATANASALATKQQKSFGAKLVSWLHSRFRGNPLS